MTHSGLCAFKSLTPQILEHFFQQFQQNTVRVETAILFSISMRQKCPTIGCIRAQITGRARWGQRSKVNERSILCTEVNLSPLHRQSHLEFRQIGLRVDLELTNIELMDCTLPLWRIRDSLTFGCMFPSFTFRIPQE